MDGRSHQEQDRRRPWPRVRVLVAFEEVRRMYREAIAGAVGDMRPALEVHTSSLAGIGPELRRFEPHLVVCSQTGEDYPGGRGAWVQVPTDDEATDVARRARICLEGERWDTDGPTLGEILEVVDETWRRLRERRLNEAC